MSCDRAAFRVSLAPFWRRCCRPAAGPRRPVSRPRLVTAAPAAARPHRARAGRSPRATRRRRSEGNSAPAARRRRHRHRPDGTRSRARQHPAQCATRGRSHPVAILVGVRQGPVPAAEGVPRAAAGRLRRGLSRRHAVSAAARRDEAKPAKTVWTASCRAWRRRWQGPTTATSRPRA